MDKRDEDRVSLDPLDPETALKALLAVDPHAEPADEPEREPDDVVPDAAPGDHGSE
jgi:hypothetical protein